MLDGVEWVLFDAVGTLIYPDPPVAQAYHAAGQQFGSRLSVEEIGRRFAAAFSAGHSGGGPTSEVNERERWRAIVVEVFRDVGDETEALFESLWNHFARPQHWRTYEDVAALTELHHRSYRVGIASNFDSRLENIVLAHPQLEPCSVVFVSSSVGYAKPDRPFFRAIEERLGVDSSKIALVGDDEVNDVEGAVAAGWKAVRLDRSGMNSLPGTIRLLAELVE